MSQQLPCGVTQQMLQAPATTGCVKKCPAALAPQLPISQQWLLHTAAVAPQPLLPAQVQSQAADQVAAAPIASHAGFAAPIASHAGAAAPSAASALAAAMEINGSEQMQQLIGHLQLRLRLAEEATALAQQESQRERQQMQARLAVLEGRVKFLEAGAEALALPWGVSAAASPLKLLPPLLHATSAATAVAHQQRWPATWKQQSALVEQPQSASAQLNPLFEQQKWQIGAPSSSWAREHHPAPAGRGPAALSSPAAVPAVLAPVPAAPRPLVAAESSVSTAATPNGGVHGGVRQLISSMQGRLTDADDLLRMLVRQQRDMLRDVTQSMKGRAEHNRASTRQGNCVGSHRDILLHRRGETSAGLRTQLLLAAADACAAATSGSCPLHMGLFWAYLSPSPPATASASMGAPRPSAGERLRERCGLALRRGDARCAGDLLLLRPRRRS